MTAPTAPYENGVRPRSDACPRCASTITWQDYPSRTIGAACERRPPHFAELAELRRIAAGEIVHANGTGPSANGAHPVPSMQPRPIKATRPTVTIINAVDLLAKEFPEPRQVVAGVIPEGLVLFNGREKMGKSWAMLGVACAVALGGHAFGVVPVDHPGDVLYLALEDGERRLQRRLRQLTTADPRLRRLSFATVWPRLDTGGLGALAEWLESHPEARLIIIDTLKRIRPRERAGASVYGGDYDAMAPLADLARRFNVAIVAVHHNRKAGSDDALDMVSGSTGLAAAADAVLILQRERGSADAVLYVTGRDIEEREHALRWNAHTVSWTILGDAAEYRLTAERAAVVRALRQAGVPLGPKEVADLTGRPGGATRKLMADMSRDGLIVTTERYGKYTLGGVTDGLGNTGNSGNSSWLANLTEAAGPRPTVTQAGREGNTSPPAAGSDQPTVTTVTTVTGDVRNSWPLDEPSPDDGAWLDEGDATMKPIGGASLHADVEDAARSAGWPVTPVSPGVTILGGEDNWLKFLAAAPGHLQAAAVAALRKGGNP